jgi:SAM-dependent methyltransferase
MTWTYGAVDESRDPAGAADWQQRMSTWSAVRAYKERTYELLRDARSVLDVGCGPGVDVVALGTSRAIGVDPSATMCAHARTTGATVSRGLADALPFRDGAFGGCRTDRVLQHVPDAGRALTEMVRVTAAGGVLVAAEPDQESLVISVPGVSTELCDRVKALRRDVGYRNGRLASRLPDVFASEGLTDVAVEAFPLVLTDPGDAFGLPSWLRGWRERDIGGFSDADLREWDAGMRRAADAGLVYAFTFFVVSGRRPT